MDPSRYCVAIAPAGLSRRVVVVAILVVTAIGGCARDPLRESATPDPIRECGSLFATDDARILHAGVRDAQYRAIPGHPYLRIDRFHAALTTRLGEPAARATWLRRLAAFDATSRRIEHRNLAPAARPGAAEIAALDRCAQRAIAALLADEGRFAALLTRIRIDDNYSLWRRALGLYPLAAPFALRGVARLQAHEGRYFTAPAASNPDPGTGTGTGTAYGFSAPERPEQVAGLIAQAPRDALGMPLLDAAARARLIAAHSPVFAVAGDAVADRIGRVSATAAGVHVDVGDPVMYTYLTYMEFAGDVLAQLNYVVWFPARTARSAFDIYAGALDGITWRVTLDRDGSVLLADTMHNCGCYYMAFPGRALKPRTGLEEFAEPLWIPQTLPRPDAGRAVIQLSTGEHYVRGIRAAHDDLAITPMRELPYAALKNLAVPDGAMRSLFGADGIVAESARAERFVLWPLGVRSAGAMREAGHHAIAFVGERHFDDPDLLDRYFERVTSP